jgi:hypothetical protein
MRKLKLDVDALQVDSFVADPQAARGGSVAGHGGGAEFTLVEADSSGCDGAGWFSLPGSCAGCPTVATCVGPTYCCPPTWRPSCNPSCNISCDYWNCGL